MTNETREEWDGRKEFEMEWRVVDARKGGLIFGTTIPTNVGENGEQENGPGNN